MFRTLVLLSAVTAVALAFSVPTESSAEEKKEKKASIKMVMKVAMKGGLAKKVASGNASAEEKKQLVALVTDLAAAKPPKGEADSWKAKTGALVEAATHAAEGKDGAGAALMKAMNCGACHKAHKG